MIKLHINFVYFIHLINTHYYIMSLSVNKRDDNVQRLTVLSNKTMLVVPETHRNNSANL